VVAAADIFVLVLPAQIAACQEVEQQSNPIFGNLI